MAINLLGFTIGRTTKESEGIATEPATISASAISPDEYDGSYSFETGGIMGTYVDFTGAVRDENALIQRYRGLALFPEVDNAIEDICNEAIVMGSDRKPVKVGLGSVKLSEAIKNKMQTEFDYVLRLMDFHKKAYEIFRRWYVDSKLYYQIIIDETDPIKGIQELRPIDPTKIKKIRKVVRDKTTSGKQISTVKNIEEYYVYTNTEKDSIYPTSNAGLNITKDSIAYANSGLVDANSKRVVGYLQKAIRPVNMLRQIEDAVVVYRVSRAPERRVFYIDVGNLPKQKAEQYLREVMQRYRTKMIYDQGTGQVNDSRDHMSMLEDYYLPRREGGRGTEISTLPGGQNLGQMEDVEYLLKKVYTALNVPITRMMADNGFNMGRSAEITRDEVKFYKYIERLRTRFSHIFLDVLRVQCILKGIITEDDWNEISPNIEIIFNRDSYFTELKENEILTNRLQMLGQIQPLIGLYFSEEYVKRNILRMSDEEIIQMQNQINMERETGQIAPSPEEQGLQG
tara:strand:+ start:3027 stop:4565 length:1539 start_codon:yes stop_codon:yes gene_type:complete